MAGWDICADCAPPSSKEMFIQRIKRLKMKQINDICFCGKKVNKYKRNLAKQYCCCCCRAYEHGTTEFYVCRMKKCIYRKISGNHYWLCAECRDSVFNKSRLQKGHQFIFEKTMNSVNRISEQICDVKDMKEIGKRIKNIRALLYQRWIVKLKATDFGQTEYYKKLSAHYNEMYEKSMTDIRDLIDLCELELDKQRIFINKEEKNANKMNQIALKWNNLQIELKEADNGQNTAECYFKSQCPSRDRISFIMSLFNEYPLTDYIQIFNHSLNGYLPVSLLDDFEHIQSFHSDMDSDLGMVQFEDSDIDLLDDRSRNIFNLSLKVHEFIKCNHSKKENKKEENVQMVRPIKWDKQREKNNKFVQEMESEQITENDDKKEEGSMDDLFQMLITKGMNKEK